MTALIAPARHRRAALVAGGVLGTLPDLDVIPITLSGADAVSRISLASRTFAFLAPAGGDRLVALGWVLRRSWAPGLVPDGQGYRQSAAARRTLAAEGLQDAPRFSVPIPFNTLLWRVVVMTPDEFLEGERSSSPLATKHCATRTTRA